MVNLRTPRLGEIRGVQSPYISIATTFPSELQVIPAKAEQEIPDPDAGQVRVVFKSSIDCVKSNNTARSDGSTVCAMERHPESKEVVEEDMKVT